MEGIKSFGTHVTEKTPRHLLHCFLVGHKIKWAKNANIWPKMSVLGQIWPFLAKNPNSYESKQSFGTHITEKTLRHLVCIFFWSRIGSNGLKMSVLGQIWPFWGQISIFFGGDGVKLLVSSDTLIQQLDRYTQLVDMFHCTS